jgi:diguanylate cyclase (GGDEF)-like protein
MVLPEKEAMPELSKRVYVEQVSLLYTGYKYRPALHIISLIMYLFIIINHVNPFYAYTWAIILIAVNVYRFIDTSRTQKILDEVEDFKKIHHHYALCAGLLGAVYSFGFVFFFDFLPLINQVYLMMLLSVMAPAGLVSFASDKFSFYMFFYSLILPVICRIFFVGEIEYFNIGICSIIYMLIINKLFTWNYNVLTNAIRLKYENEQLLSHLQGINNRLIELSVIDELTQIANRRSLDETLEKEWLRSKRMKSPISILMIDVDYFKQFNDEFGHIKGDECLRYIAKFLKENMNRPGDFLARYGGEEFCIIMPETNLNGAVSFAEKIHSGIRELKISNPRSEVSKYVTVCIGIASVVPAVEESYMDLIYTSDKALYKAKNEGRNIIRTIDVLEKNPRPQLVV